MFALVDCNNFFVSCERVFDLSLIGKPVAILSNNDGCIIARSNELKALGVKMCAPYFQVRQILQQNNVAVLSCNYELYGDISNRVMSILGQFTPELEIYSVDEAFLHLPQHVDYENYARHVRQTVMEVAGIPTGIGIAPTKTLAKIANHIAKKSKTGVFLMPEDRASVLDSFPVDEVWGIGRRTAAKLAGIGVTTVGRLLTIDPAFLRKTFSIHMVRLVQELRGEVSRETIDPEEAQQSLMVSRSFGKPVIDPVELEESVAAYVAKAAGKLRVMGQRTAGVTICCIAYPEHGSSDFYGNPFTENIAFPEPLNETGEMMCLIRPALSKLFQPGRRYRKSSVACWGLTDADTVQQDMFSDKRADSKIYNILDNLNQRYGKRAVFHAAEGTEQNWVMRRDRLSSHYTTDWNQLLIVK